MPLSVQSKVLRVLEQKEVMRLGADYVIPLNVRIIAAANEPLREAVRAGKFRQDLYFRLNTFELKILPLRERREDILYLFKYYLGQYSGVPTADISLDEAFVKQLLGHDWLGNVRELKNTALRYATFGGDNSNGDILDVVRSRTDDAKDGMVVNEDYHIDLKALNRTVESLVIQNLLDRRVPKQTIARLLGISRQALFQKINKMKDEAF